MRCHACQGDNPDAARFCQHCGAGLARRCARCGAELGPEARFCTACGQAAEAPAGPDVAAAPRAYTPPHLAERILTSRAALEGERKQVTVLFVDVVESSRLAERLDPEAMHEVMDRALRLMAEAVHRYEGTVNQFLGDGLMALFGAPLALEDHALRAAEAALAIQETIAGLDVELARERGVELRVRVGLNTGPVVVGRIGDDLRMDYTAVGDTTHLAARMQQSAEPGTVQATDATYRLLEGHVASEPLGPVTVKGRSEPVLAHRIVRRRRRTRLEVRAERGLTSLVGRQRELDLLRERFQHVLGGRGQVVGVVGEPGVGKSRLLHEFRASLPVEAVVFEGDCLAYAQSTPYTPVADVLRASFGVEDGDNPFQLEAKLREGLERVDPALAEVGPFLRELLGLPAAAAVAKLDAKSRRRRTFEAIRALTAAASRRRPHAIVVEDLHWIDPTSEDYLAFLVDSLAAMPLMLVTTSRPGHAPRWADRAFFTQIVLDLLDEAATGEILAARLGTREFPAELVSLVHARAEGNPLFVEEIARSLMERGALVRKNGSVVWAGAPLVDLPATGQDIIRARIDQLPEPVKRTLQAAAVIGREFSSRLLPRIVENPDVVDDHLTTLKRVELVHETRVFPDVEYAFRHALIQDVAYETLLARRRRELHAAIGRALEELHGDRASEHAGVLAHHFTAADERAKAVEYLTRAGDRAAGAFANREASGHYEHGLTLLDEGDPRLRARLLNRLVNCLVYGGNATPDECLRRAQAALEINERLGDQREAMASHMAIASLYISGFWDGAREDAALEHLEAATAIAESDPDSVSKGLAHQRAAHLYLHRGAPATALGWARRAIDVFGRLGATMGTSYGTAQSLLGRIDEGVAYNEANWGPVVAAGNPLVIAILGHELGLTTVLGRDIARSRAWGERALSEVVKAREANASLESTVRRPLAIALTLAGDLPAAGAHCARIVDINRLTWAGCPWEDVAAPGLFHLRAGGWTEARGMLDQALGVMTDRNQIAAVGGCSFVLGCLDLAEGKLGDAEVNLQASLAICRDGGNVLFELWVLPVLTELYLATGRAADAAACVERGFSLLAPDRSWYGLPAGMHLARGMLARERGDREEAEASLGRAVAINREHGLPWDEAKAELEWARMLRARDRAGDREAARERLARARELFERVGARRDVERVLAAGG